MRLRLQASTPSNHLYSVFLLPAPPQFLYQAPPGAQQLALPDFSNVPHLGHVTVLLIVKVAVNMVIAVRAISSRSGIGRRVTHGRVVGVTAAAHTACEIDPGEPINMSSLLAFE